MQRLLAMKKVETDFSNLDSLLNATKPPIFWLEKAMVKKQLTIWSLSDIQKTLNEINETELLCKKKPQLSKVIFFKFFTSVCKKVSSSF
mgnify:FL=1